MVPKEEYKNQREIIKANIGYDTLRQDKKHFDDGELDEIVQIMTEAVCSTRSTIRINGEEKPTELVKDQLLKLDGEHIVYIAHCLRENTTKISNIRAYLLSALYNAPATINHYYRSAVNHDLYGS